MLKKSSGTKPQMFDITFESTSVQSVRDIVNSYSNHKNILKIKQVVNDGSYVSDSERFSFKTVNETEIKKLLKNLAIKNASSTDTIPLKLIKLSVNFLTPLLIKAKNKISNFRLVSVLNTFPKIYERVIKDQIVCGMKKYFSPFLSVHSYSFQNILISLIEMWRKNLDNKFVVGAVLTDLPKAFFCMPHNLLIAKLSAYNFSDKICLLSIHTWQIAINQPARDYNSDDPQESILGLILFNVVLASLYNFADDNTLSAIATII